MSEVEERKIDVRVSFPISKKGAYEAEDHGKTTVSTVLAAAMKHFEVQDDSQFTYVLAFDGQEQAGSVEIGFSCRGTRQGPLHIGQEDHPRVSIDEESALNLEADEGAVLTFMKENDGDLVRDDLVGDGGERSVYWATFRPRSVPKERFIARIEWFAYPYQEPSIKFADAIRGAC